MDARWIQRLERTMTRVRAEELEKEKQKSEQTNAKYRRTQYVQPQTEWNQKEEILKEEETFSMDNNRSNHWDIGCKHTIPLHVYKNTCMEPLPLSYDSKKEIKREQKQPQKEEEEDQDFLIEKCNIHKRIIENYKADNIISLYSWQVECLGKLRNVQWSLGQNFIYTAPTSGGKTLVSEIFIFEELYKIDNSWNKMKTVKIFFAFPLHALIFEKMSYFSKKCEGTNIVVGNEIQDTDIILCTYERLNGWLNKKEVPTNSIIIIDEFHIINEPPRGIYIENIISKILYLNRKHCTIKIISMSGTLNNLPLLKKWMNAKVYVSEYRPQQIQEYYICNLKVYEKIKEGFIKKCDLYNKIEEDQLEETTHIYNHSNILKDATVNVPLQCVIETFMHQHKNNVCNNDFITNALLLLSMESQQKLLNVLIFCRSKKACEQFASMIGKFLFFLNSSQPTVKSEEMECMYFKRDIIIQKIGKIDYLIGNNMKEMIRTGVAYYHSTLNTQIKRILENAFKEKTLFLLTCTSSLAVGLNLSVDRVIISSPFVGNLFLTETIYKQMVGRAARHRQGDSYILVETSQEKKLLQLLSKNKNVIKSTMHTNMETLEKYCIELTSLLETSFSFSTLLYLFSFSFFFCEVTANREKEEQEEPPQEINEDKNQTINIYNANHFLYKGTIPFKNNDHNIITENDRIALKKTTEEINNNSLQFKEECFDKNIETNAKNITNSLGPLYEPINHNKEQDSYITNSEEVYYDVNKSIVIDFRQCTKDEIYFYKKKKQDLHKLVEYMIKNECVEIKNNEFYITTLGRSICISNFSITAGVELVRDVNSFNNIVSLYNHMHLCYIVASSNINVSSFFYNISYLKELITNYLDSHSQNVIINILHFNLERINVLYMRRENNHGQGGWSRCTNVIKDKDMESKYNKLYLSILLFMFLQKCSNPCICKTFKITENILQCILQKTLMYTHILITFFDHMGLWILTNILKKFVQDFNKRSKEVFTNFNSDSSITNKNKLTIRNIYRKF